MDGLVVVGVAWCLYDASRQRTREGNKRERRRDTKGNKGRLRSVSRVRSSQLSRIAQRRSQLSSNESNIRSVEGIEKFLFAVLTVV